MGPKDQEPGPRQPEDQRNRGPRDQRTRGPEDQGTRGPKDQNRRKSPKVSQTKAEPNLGKKKTMAPLKTLDLKNPEP